MTRQVIVLIGLLSVATAARGQTPELRDGASTKKNRTRNILLVTTDGLRWQEVFRGADPTLMNKENGGVEDIERLNEEFGGETPEIRRKELLPFIWNVMAKNGQLYGDADNGSEAKVTNGRNFSYPGYNEIFTGFNDPSIDSNEKFNNGNVSVLEWLHGQDDFHRRIAAFGSWDRFPYILNQHAQQNPGRRRLEAPDRTGAFTRGAVALPARRGNAPPLGRLHVRHVHLSRRA